MRCRKFTSIGWWIADRTFVVGQSDSERGEAGNRNAGDERPIRVHILPLDRRSPRPAGPVNDLIIQTLCNIQATGSRGIRGT